MAGKKQEKVRERDITGLKYFQDLLPLFDRLHDVGCDRDKAGKLVEFKVVSVAHLHFPLRRDAFH